MTYFGRLEALIVFPDSCSCVPSFILLPYELADTYRGRRIVAWAAYDYPGSCAPSRWFPSALKHSHERRPYGLAQRGVRVSPMRTASGYQPPAIPYHTPVRVSLSTPNNDPVSRNAQYITNIADRFAAPSAGDTSGRRHTHNAEACYFSLAAIPFSSVQAETIEGSDGAVANGRRKKPSYASGPFRPRSENESSFVFAGTRPTNESVSPR